jgi:hypothetical protein
MPQTSVWNGVVDDPERDYDLFPIGTAGLALASGSAVALSNVVPDGYSLKVARLTLTSTGATCYLKLQIVATGAGVVDAQGLATQTVWTHELGGTSTVVESEDTLEFTVPAGFQLFASVSGASGTVDITGNYRYLRGSFT